MLALVRVDDRLVHGQVVVGWARALGANLIALVDDQVSGNAWEQDLYRMGVPPGMTIEFASVADAAGRVVEWDASRHRTILVVADVATLVRLCAVAPQIRRVNLGGLHQAPGREQRLPYVFMTDEEAAQLKHLATQGVQIVAQDVPSARAVSIAELP